MFWAFEHLNFEFVSSFDIRISDFWQSELFLKQPMNHHIDDADQKPDIQIGSKPAFNQDGNALKLKNIQGVFGKPDQEDIDHQYKEPCRDQDKRKRKNLQNWFYKAI